MVHRIEPQYSPHFPQSSKSERVSKVSTLVINGKVRTRDALVLYLLQGTHVNHVDIRELYW